MEELNTQYKVEFKMGKGWLEGYLTDLRVSQSDLNTFEA